MSTKTWLLSATMLMAPADEVASAPVEYTPEVRTEVSTEMRKDAAASEKTYTDFTAAQQQVSQNTGREDTATALKNQSRNAQEIVSAITPRTDVSFINQDPNKYNVLGDYVHNANVIRVELNEKVTSKTYWQNGNSSTTVAKVSAEDKKEGAYYTDKEIPKDKLLTLLHEHHHQYCHNKTTTTEDGKEIRVSDLPMSMQQAYKVEQADEIGSNIASCLGLRQMYIEAKTEYKQSKEDALNQLPKNKKYRELRATIEKEAAYTVESGKVKFKDKKGKDIEVDISELGPETEAKLKDNRQKQVECDHALDNGRDKMFSDYTESVKNGSINPLDSKDFEKEMALIGSSVAKNWQKEYSGEMSNYKFQCQEAAIDYLKDHDIKDVKPNEKNYDEALSAKLTVGGYDFSKHVKDQLKCNDGVIVAADNRLANGSTKSNALKYDENNSAYVSYGKVEQTKTNAKTGKETKDFANHPNENESYAFYLTKNSKVGDKIEDVKLQVSEETRKYFERNPNEELEKVYAKLEKGITAPVKWNDKDSKDYNKAISELRKGIKDYSDEDKQKIEQKIQELGLDKKKPGETLTEEELAKYTKLCKTIRDVNYNYDTSSAGQATFDLEQLYQKKQKESVPVLCEYCQYIEKKAKESYSYKIADNPQADADYFYPDPVKLKEAIVNELSGEGEKSYENPRIKTEPGKEYKGTKASTVNMMDFSQPFLTEQQAEERTAAAKARIAETKKTAEPEKEAPKQQNVPQTYLAGKGVER